jgi:maltose O-acetyltransferase
MTEEETWRRIALRAAREPHNVLQVVRAQLRLRACKRVPFTTRLRGNISVHNYGRIHLGEHVRIDGETVRVELVTWKGGVLAIGDGTFLNYGVSLSAHDHVAIGRDCLIGNYVTIMDNDYHDLVNHKAPGRSAPIHIGDRVWLGLRSIILKGVTIGDDSVVGAGSVVTSDIPPRSLAFGVPAKVVRSID